VPENSHFRWRGCVDLCLLFSLPSSPIFILLFPFISHMLYARGWKTKVTIPRLLWVDEVISVQSSFARKECLAISFYLLFSLSFYSLRILLLSTATTSSSIPRPDHLSPQPHQRLLLCCPRAGYSAWLAQSRWCGEGVTGLDIYGGELIILTQWSPLETQKNNSWNTPGIRRGA
jgi:hypothetical protein